MHVQQSHDTFGFECILQGQFLHPQSFGSKSLIGDNIKDKLFVIFIAPSFCLSIIPEIVINLFNCAGFVNPCNKLYCSGDKPLPPNPFLPYNPLFIPLNPGG